MELNTHDIGRIYWHLDKRKRSWKPTQVSRAQAVDGHLRRGLGLFMSLPWVTWGVVIGWWGHAAEDELGTRTMGDRTEEVRAWPSKSQYDSTWSRIAQIERKVRDGVQD
jgi:hypothetical protein